MANTNRVRVGGSGFTLFTYGGAPITFCNQVAHQSPAPVAQAVPIQPMDEPYPVEIVTPAAATMGTITLEMFELFGSGGHASKIWDRLGDHFNNQNLTAANPFGTPSGNYVTVDSANLNLGIKFPGSSNTPFAGAVDIVDIFIRQAIADPSKLGVTQIIRPLSTGDTTSSYDRDIYKLQYHGCVITDVQDGETVAVGTLPILKQITISYRYVTRNGKPSSAFALRDGVITYNPGNPLLNNGQPAGY